MAIYKSDIVDINLETCNIHRAFLNRTIGSGDSGADHFGIRVFRNSEPVDLTGVSVQGIFLPPQGSPIAITDGNSVSGNEAYVVLPQACYNYDGQFCLSIKLVGGGVTGTMRIVDGMVDNTHSTGTVAPTETVPTYQEILSTYDDMVAATAAANGAIAKPYAQLTFPVTVGTYTIVDGALKRAIVPIATSETYTAAHWTDAKLGPDVSALKSAFEDNCGIKMVGSFVDGYAYKTANGSTITPGSPISASAYACTYVECVAGDVFTIDLYNGGTANYRPWCFINSSGTQLTKASDNVGAYKNIEITAPENAAYLIINASKTRSHQIYKGKLTDKRVTVLENRTEEIGDIVDDMVVPYILIDGYDANNNNTANINRAPWMFPSKNANAVIASVKLKIKTAGTLSFGIYDSTIENGDTYDSSKYQLIKTFTVTSTGTMELFFNEPVQIPTNKAFAVGLTTDTAEFAYGAYGKKGFYYNVDGTITYYKSASLGITVSGYETGTGSILSGKRISIFGDSISTFEGWIPEGNATYYPASGVSKVQQTWWKKTIDALGLSLVVNNSWSGRAVSSCRDNETGHGTDAGYKVANVLQLKDGTTLPEIIIVKLGINDFNHGAYLGDYDGSAALPDNPATFTAAYAMMLDLIMTNFPLAKVYCCTLMQCEMNNSVTGFPEINTQGESLIQWNEAIRKLAHAFGAEILDHDVCGLTYYNLSTYMGDYSGTTHKGLHPNAAGHSLIANQTILQLDPSVRQRF